MDSENSVPEHAHAETVILPGIRNISEVESQFILPDRKETIIPDELPHSPLCLYVEEPTSIKLESDESRSESSESPSMYRNTRLRRTRQTNSTPNEILGSNGPVTTMGRQESLMAVVKTEVPEEAVEMGEVALPSEVEFQEADLHCEGADSSTSHPQTVGREHLEPFRVGLVEHSSNENSSNQNGDKREESLLEKLKRSMKRIINASPETENVQVEKQIVLPTLPTISKSSDTTFIPENRKVQTDWCSGNTSYTCSVCYKTFAMRYNLLRHRQEAHPNVKALKCFTTETRKKKRSFLWIHFTKESEFTARCNLCLALISYRGGTTSNLKKHLTAKHPEVVPDGKCNKQIRIAETDPDCPGTSTSPLKEPDIIAVSPLTVPSKPSRLAVTTPFPIPLARQKKLNSFILNMIVKDMQPFSIVEDQGFKEMITAFEPLYQPPSRNMLSETLLPQTYESVMKDLKNCLAKAKYITLTTDVWTSISNEGYIAVIAHFITDSWEIFSGLLECFNFNERQTPETLANELQRVVADWGITNKIYAIVTDNTANIIEAVHLTGWNHLPCFAHTLNAVVQNGLKTMNSIQSKVKVIVDYFHRSKVATEKLDSVQLQMHRGTLPLKLKNDVIKSWNSTYYMFQRICEIQEPIETTLSVLNNPVEVLSAEEWIISKELCKIIQPFEQVMVQLSTEKDVSASKVIIISRGLTAALNRIHHTLTKNLSLQLADDLLNSLAKQFCLFEYKEILSKSAYIDPRFKKKAFPDDAALRRVKDCVISDMLELASDDSFQEENDDITLVHQSETNHAEPESPAKDHDLVWQEFDSLDTAPVKATPLFTASTKLRQYSEEPYISRKENPLEWWKTRELVYPRLSKLAKKYLCLVATSVPCERAFSKSGQVISERRSCLKSKNVQKLVFLNFNQKMLSK